MEKVNSSNFRNSFVQCIKKLITYYDMGFILNNLDSIIAFHIPYKDSTMTIQQYEINKEIAQSTNSVAEDTYSKFLQEFNLRATTFKQIRNYKPDFAENIQSFLSPEDYNAYLSLLGNCSKDISSLVFATNSVKSDYRDLLLELQDMVSEIVDSESSTRLANMEDTFILHELESLENMAIDSETQHNMNTLRKELQERTKQYEFFQKLYLKGNKINVIYTDKDKNKEKEKERE